MQFSGYYFYNIPAETLFFGLDTEECFHLSVDAGNLNYVHVKISRKGLVQYKNSDKAFIDLLQLQGPTKIDFNAAIVFKLKQITPQLKAKP